MAGTERGEVDFLRTDSSVSGRLVPVSTNRAPNLQEADSQRLRVFVSYSRDDIDFTDQLIIGLQLAGFAPTIDREGISGGEDWKLRLGGLVRETNTVVFVLSPSSSRSPVCDWEVGEAVRHGKRIVPIICRALEGTRPPTALSDLNYIYFYPERTVPGSGFAAGLRDLASVLSTDIGWHREHTRLLLRATEWESSGRQAARLLSGMDIPAAKEWVARRPAHTPEISDLHLSFIRASEEEATSRLNVERLRLEEMAAAQEARSKALTAAEVALAQAADAQRRRTRLRNLLLAAMTLAAGISGWSWYTISQGNKRLTEQVQLAKAAAVRAKSAEEKSRLGEDRAQHAEFKSIINECAASKLLLENKPDNAENLYNYLDCGVRLGYALIREKRAGDSVKLFGQINEVVVQHGADQDNSIFSFFLLLVTQGAAVAQCAAMEPKSSARSDAIAHLAAAANELLQFQPSPSIEHRWHDKLETRWREEVFRGLLYISNFSDESGDHEVAFESASKLADRLSSMPRDIDGSARDFARALDHLTWMALITKRTGAALNASERAKQIVQEFNIGDLDSVRLNHAHALLLSGQVDEARKEYQELNPDDVAKDVEKLISAGLCDELFAELAGDRGRCTAVVK
jgi:hypothetical protein